MQYELKLPSLIGILVAIVIIIIWSFSLFFICSIGSDRLSSIWILLAILGRTFIQTGLFIVAHDAIHGVVVPDCLQLNHAIGRLAVTLYAFLSYHQLSLNHYQHHLYAGQLGKDPDFHEDLSGNWLVWYLKFMQGYLNIRQVVIQFFGMGSAFIVLIFGCHFSPIDLCLFWVIPILLSTVQLFFFGTYLPHRSVNLTANFPNRINLEHFHQVNSSNYPPLLSALTCYHFGYHWEHHEYPFLPWYRLPSVRKLN